MLGLTNPTDRMMARVAVAILAIGALYGSWSFARPVYWRLYANVLRPFEDPRAEPAKEDPFGALLNNQNNDPAQGANAPAENPVSPPPAQVNAPPPAKKPFNPEDYPLTKERVHQYLQGGYIMVTWANEHYLDFARSWVYNVKRVGITGYMVGAMDDDMLKKLVDLDVNTWRMNTGIVKHDLGWGSPNFHKMGRAKIQLIQQFMAFDVNVIITDIDTMWMRNPMPFFDRFQEADILTSTDELRESVPDESLEKYPQAASAFNIGIMLFRSKSKAFVDEWVKSLENPTMWDQTAFNDLVRKGATHSEGAKNLFKGFQGTLTVGILPASIFPSGHMFFVQRKYEELGLKPYTAHATFQYSGTPGKRNRFREAQIWYDPPEYYDHPKGFLTGRIDIPKELLANATGANMKGEATAGKFYSHFALVNYQLPRVRSLLALAHLTGRAVVMPPIWCESDKYWAPLFDGNIPGSRFRKPFICPMDHVFDLEGGWAPPKPEVEFGPHIEWREYSFLNNPALPPAVNASRVVVEVCAPGTQGCSDGSSPAPVKDGRVRVMGGLDSAKLAVALKDASAAAKILDFTDLLALWPAFKEEGGWFTDPAQHQKFVRRIKHMTSVVCCLSSNPGWIWYDLMCDVPHSDRFNRKFDSWHIKRGDQDMRAMRRALLGSDEFWSSSDGISDEDGEEMVALAAASLSGQPQQQQRKLQSLPSEAAAAAGAQRKLLMRRAGAGAEEAAAAAEAAVADAEMAEAAARILGEMGARAMAHLP